jgi:hypothetical protein
MEEINLVPVDTLKDHFTAEELQGITTEQPKETEKTTETPAELAEEQDNSAEHSAEQEEPSQVGGDTAEKLKPTVIAYDRFKEINDKNKLLAAELAAVKASQQQQSAPVQQPAPAAAQTNQQPQQIDVSELIAKMADEKIRKALKITDDIETLQYTDPAKYLQYVKGVSKEEYRLEADYQQRQVVLNENLSFAQELKAIPDFPVLLQFAEAELDELPRKEARKIDEAYERVDNGFGTKDDFVVLREFAKKCQDKMKGITQAPAQGAISLPEQAAQIATTPLDKAAGLPMAQNLSGAKTSAMSWAQVEQLIRDGKSDQIPKEMLKQIDPRLV